MKNISLITIGILLFSCNRSNKNVFFGNRPKMSNEFHQIFLDRRGLFYPKQEINEKHFYSFKQKATLKNIVIPETNKEFLTENKNLDQLQEFIIKSNAIEINEKCELGKIDNVTFILVGFNNDFHNNGSLKKLEDLKNYINTYTIQNNIKKTLIVQLFWDGTKSNMSLKPAFHYKSSRVSSYYVGINLRKLINEIKVKNIQFISHSQGAAIVTEAMFNQKQSLIEGKQKKEFSIMYEKPNYFTTDKNVVAGIVAPAIPGYETFVDYGERSIPIPKPHDNYEIIVGFNRNDVALHKNMGFKILKKVGRMNRLAYAFGSTTLGSDYNSETNFVKNLFKNKFPNSKIDFIDFSNNQYDKFNQKIDLSGQKSHDLGNYIKLKEYDSFLDKIYNRK